MVQFDGLNLKCFGSFSLEITQNFTYKFGDFRVLQNLFMGLIKEGFSNLKVFLKHFRVLVKLQNHMSYNMKSGSLGL